MTTNPGSFVGLLGVDQSVLILRKGNDIEQLTVFDELERYSNIDKHNSVWSRRQEWGYFDDFAKSDTIIITNAKDENGEWNAQESKKTLKVHLMFRSTL